MFWSFYIVDGSWMNVYAAAAKWQWLKKNKETGGRPVQVLLHIVTTVRLHVINHCALKEYERSLEKYPLMIPLNWLWRFKHNCLQQFYILLIVHHVMILGKWCVQVRRRLLILLLTCTHLGRQHRMAVTRGCIDTICLSWWWARCARNM
jgi:hypothetical protein